jgi:hypothetical protein
MNYMLYAELGILGKSRLCDLNRFVKQADMMMRIENQSRNPDNIRLTLVG